MKCKYCGADLESGVLFCRECGNKVVKQEKLFCRECGAELSAGVAFCSYCGANLKQIEEQFSRKPQQEISVAPEKKLKQGSPSKSATAKRTNIKPQRKSAFSPLLIPAGLLIVVLLALVVFGGKSKESPDGSENADLADISSQDATSYHIRKGMQYAYMSDEWNVYVATAVSDSLIKLEHWEKHSSLSKSMSYSSDIGAYDINDRENGFTWIDDEHTAFSFVFQDKGNSRVKTAAAHIFTVNISEDDTFKGTDFSDDIICYSYKSDDWHLYRAIPLTDSLFKIECWSRANALLGFRFGWDWCVFDPNNNDLGFSWTDSEHTSFTLTAKDEKNESHWKESSLVLFEVENSASTYASVADYLKSAGKWPLDSADSDNFTDSRSQREKSESNNLVNVGLYQVEIPEYWRPSDESDHYMAYAETDGRVAMLEAYSQYDEEDLVSFDLLDTEDERNNAIGDLFGAIEGASEFELLDTEIVEYEPAKGVLWSFRFKIADLPLTSYLFTFPSPENNHWVTLLCAFSDNTEYRYDESFRTIISSISNIPAEPATSVQQPNNEVPASSPADDDAKQNSNSSQNSEDEILTIDNNDDLAEILKADYLDADRQAKFVEKYKGKIIEFDCIVFYLEQSPGYSTIYSYVLIPGEDQDNIGAAFFMLEDIGRGGFKWDSATRPESLMVGSKIRIRAEVKTGSDPLYIYLRPVRTWGR